MSGHPPGNSQDSTDLSQQDLEEPWDSGQLDGPSDSSSDESPTRIDASFKKRYKRLVRHERALLDDLEASSNNDLAAQLYDVHHYKTIAGTDKDPTSTHDTKSGALTPSWLPNDSWTAWPLPLHRVPRQDEVWSRRMRLPDDNDLATRDTKRRRLESSVDGGELSQLVRARLEAAQRAFFCQFSDRLAHNPKFARQQGSRKEPRGTHTLSGRDGVTGMDEIIEASIFENARFFATSCRSILGKIDLLLVALAQAQSNNLSTDLGDSESSAEDSMPSHALPDQQTNSAGRKSKSTARKRSRSTDHRPELTNPRDWSEVLSCASFMGWDPNVVRRAHMRCSRLFDDNVDSTSINVSGLFDDG